MTIASPTRELRYEPSRWDLSQLIPTTSESELAAQIDKLNQAVAAFAGRREELAPDLEPARFAGLLEEYEALLEHMTVLDSYASLSFSADTQSQAALTYQNRVSQALVGAHNRILFFGLWWKGLSDSDADRFLAAVSDDFAHYLRELRRFRPFTLDEKSEQIISLKDADGSGALLTLYAVLTNRLEFELEVDGEVRKLTRDGLMSYASYHRASVREAAYNELYRVYGKEATPLAQIYSHRVRDWYNEQVTLRGFSSPIAVRNVANDIPDVAVDVLLQVIREHAPLFQRYFRLKAGWLGVDRLRRYDIYAPLADSDRLIPYPDAVQMVIDTFARFDPIFAEHTRKVFDEQHMDSEDRPGKRGGAFCATVLPRQTPWVLVNYTGRVRDVTTVAHELGHAIHSMMARDHSLLTQRSSLPLAETASVFAEMLMTDRLLEEEKDPLARSELLLASIDNIYATVLRQAYFVLFEIAAHDAILAGMSPEGLNALYLDNLREQFGDSVDVPASFQHEWLCIPHIFQTPFYCYSYCFGQLLVLALYRRYLEEGESFKPGYLKMLAYGGSARPVEILAEVGVDMTNPAFWRGGFEVLRSMIDDLEANLRSADR